MTDTDHLDDPDHELVDRLLALHPPRSSDVAEAMDLIRGQFRNLGHTVVAFVPRTPDRTVALRSLHRACMDAIAALACNQDGPAVAGESTAKVGGTLAAHVASKET